MKRLVVAVVVLAGPLSACSSTAATVPVTPSPSPASTPLPDMWGTFADTRQGFSIAVPTAWDVVARDSPTFAPDLQAVGDQSPDLGKYFTDAFAKNDQLRLLAADPRTLQQGFAANVNVMTSDLGADATAPTVGDVVTAKLKRLSAAPEVGKPLRHNDRLAGLDAARIDYTLTANASTVLVRSLVAEWERSGRRFLIEVTMGAPATGAETLFTAVQRLFRLYDPSPPPRSPRAVPTPSASALASSGDSEGSSG